MPRKAHVNVPMPCEANITAQTAPRIPSPSMVACATLVRCSVAQLPGGNDADACTIFDMRKHRHSKYCRLSVQRHSACGFTCAGPCLQISNHSWQGLRSASPHLRCQPPEAYGPRSPLGYPRETRNRLPCFQSRVRPFFESVMSTRV